MRPSYNSRQLFAAVEDSVVTALHPQVEPEQEWKVGKVSTPNSISRDD